MMQFETFENTSTITNISTLNIAEIAPNLYAYKLVTLSEPLVNTGTFKTDAGNLTKLFEGQGFVDSKNLEAIKDGRNYTNRKLTIISDADKEELRVNGWVHVCNSGKYDVYQPNKVWDTVTSANFNINNLVRFAHDSHMLFDHMDNVLPVGVTFDYMAHGAISEGSYDLKKLATHLLARSDCIIAGKTNKWSSYVDYDTPATNVNEAIVDVPSYNRERGSSQTVYFTWAPTAEVYAKMWKYCKEKNPNYPSTYIHQAIFELDLLGLRASGAAKFDAYHKSTKYNSKETG